MSFSNVFKAPFFKINWVTKCVEDYFLSNEKTLDLEKYNMTLSDRYENFKNQLALLYKRDNVPRMDTIAGSYST